MKVEVKYEWCRETVDEDGDIIDLNFSDSLDNLINDEGDLVLVRNLGNDAQGLINRAYAYVKDGKLPTVFSDESGNETYTRVPKRFQKEFTEQIRMKIN